MIPAEIESIHRMTPRVKQFRIRRLDDDPFAFEPGQHTQLHFEADDEEVVRPYTATSLPGTDRITLAIKRYDDGTASVYMHEREPGDTIRIEALEGNLFLRDVEEDLVFVSSGTGITPMMAMVRQYCRAGSGEAYFLYGEKTQGDVMYRETLDALDAQVNGLTVAYSLSEEEWHGLTGHVQTHLDDLLDTFTGKHFYVCGVPEMVVETTELLQERGVPTDYVFSEGWEDDEVTEA